MSCVLWPPYIHHKSKEFNAKIQDYNYSWGLLWYFTPDCLDPQSVGPQDLHWLPWASWIKETSAVQMLDWGNAIHGPFAILVNLLYIIFCTTLIYAAWLKLPMLSLMMKDKKLFWPKCQRSQGTTSYTQLPCLKLKWPDVPWVDSIS